MVLILFEKLGTASLSMISGTTAAANDYCSDYLQYVNEKSMQGSIDLNEH